MKQRQGADRKEPTANDRRRAVPRRGFMRVCTTAVAAVAAHPALLAASTDAAVHLHERTRLISATGEPLTGAGLEPGQSYVFNYPFVTTPCFLLNLDQPVQYGLELETRDGEPYVWQGGVGPRSSIVGFVAICAHKMSHPSKTVSFLNFRAQEIKFRNLDKQTATGAGLIQCCSEHSVYDPSQGARVLGGPAKEPLAAVLLEHDDSDDSLYALGIYGGQMYQVFFDQFGFRLAVEHGISDVREPVSGEAVVVTAETYSKTQTSCG